MNLKFTVKQIVIFLKPDHTHFQFDFPNYSSTYLGKKIYSGYVLRRFPSFSYRISKQMSIYLFIYKNIEYFSSDVGFTEIYQNIVYDLRPYLSVFQKDLNLCFRVSNIQSIFHIEGDEFKIFKNPAKLIEIVKEFSLNDKSIICIPRDESGFTINIIFKNRGAIRIFSKSANVVSNSFDSLRNLVDYFEKLLQFESNGRRHLQNSRGSL